MQDSRSEHFLTSLYKCFVYVARGVENSAKCALLLQCSVWRYQCLCSAGIQAQCTFLEEGAVLGNISGTDSSIEWPQSLTNTVRNSSTSFRPMRCQVQGHWAGSHCSGGDCSSCAQRQPQDEWGAWTRQGSGSVLLLLLLMLPVTELLPPLSCWERKSQYRSTVAGDAFSKTFFLNSNY